MKMKKIKNAKDTLPQTDKDENNFMIILHVINLECQRE